MTMTEKQFSALEDYIKELIKEAVGSEDEVNVNLMRNFLRSAVGLDWESGD